MAEIKINLLGINTEDIDNIEANGTCSQLNNIFPSGNPANHNWRPRPEEETIDAFTTASLDAGNDEIVEVLVKSRDSAGNLVFWVLFKDDSPSTKIFKIAEFTKSGTTYSGRTVWDSVTANLVTRGRLLSINNGNDLLYMATKQTTGNETDYQAWVGITKGTQELPLWMHRGHHALFCRPEYTTYTQAEWDKNFPLTTLYGGFDITKKKRYVSYVFAVRVPDGTYMLHSMPMIIAMDDSSGSTDKTVGSLVLDYDDGGSYTKAYEHSDVNGNLAAQGLSNFDDLATSFTAYGMRDQAVVIFSTLLHDTYTEALHDGVYFKQGEWDEWTIGDMAADKHVKTNEVILATREVLNPDPFSYHWYSGRNIGVYRNRVVLNAVITDFPLPTYDWHGNAWWQSTDFGNGWEAVEGRVRVTITVDGVAYYRTSKVYFPRLSSAADSWYHFGFYTYPDRRATHVNVYVKDAAAAWFEVLTKTLHPHPTMNFSYHTNTVLEILNTGAPQPKKTDGSSLFTSWPKIDNVSALTAKTDAVIAAFTAEENIICLHEPNKVKISSVFHQHFPLTQVFEFDDEVIGSFDNTGAVSEGQFGSYPLYILCKNKIFGMEAGPAGVLFQREVEISGLLGVTSPKAFTVMDGALFFVSTRGIHILTGSGGIENIHYALADSADWNFDQFIGEGKIWEVHGDKHDDKVYFTPPFEPNSNLTFIYDTRYRKWYSIDRLRSLQRKDGFLYGVGGDVDLIWKSALAAEANEWQSIAWSSELSLFVAVAQSGTNRVMSAPDGRTWTARAASEANQWQVVVWAPELTLFCAVSLDGTNRVMTSPDGITWTARSEAEANAWRSITWSPELTLFCAVASSGTNRVMTSANGTSWTTRTAAAANEWISVIWSPELTLFCAVSVTGANRVMTSPDGITWTARTASEANDWRSITWSPDLTLFCAVANNGTNRVMTSPDGITWTARAAAEAVQYRSVIWSSELALFIAVANTLTNRVMTSPDGIAWTSALAAGSDNWESITWSPELTLFCTVADTGTNRSMVSKYGTTVPLATTNTIYDISKPSTTADSKSMTIVTNDFNLGNESVYKKLKASILKGVYAGGSGGLVIILQGKRKILSTYNDLINITINDDSTFEDLTLKSNFGSMQTFRLKITGKAKIATTIIQELNLNIEPRGVNLKT